MIRMMGAALLLGGSAALGFAAVRRLERRTRDLRELIAGLEVMERELEWRLTPLPELLRRAAEQAGDGVSAFFLMCAQGAERLNGRTFSEVWRQELTSAQLSVNEADRGLLEQLGGVLGRYDGDSQRQALAAAVERLEEQRTEAMGRRARLGKVYGVLSVTAGIFLVILLI